MSTLRTQILKASLPLIPKYSFTRETLSVALTTLPPSDPSHRSEPLGDTVLDTIFGYGSATPAQALVGAWAEEGNASLTGGNLRERLHSRLEYSSRVGEHLVEAYALMTSPSTTPSLPLPTIPSTLLPLLSKIRLPPLYAPPSRSPLSGEQERHQMFPETDAASALSDLFKNTSGRLPLYSFHLGAVPYAWNVADAALRIDEKAAGVVKGLANEPTGSGPEWYTSRATLMAAYLSAESRLLQAYPPSIPSDSPNPYLPSAQAVLNDNLDKYDAAAKAIADGDVNLSYALGYLEHLGRSAIGIIRSRGL